MAKSGGGEQLAKILAAIVAVALVTTIVSRPAAVTNIRAMGESFSGIIRSAMRAGG